MYLEKYAYSSSVLLKEMSMLGICSSNVWSQFTNTKFREEQFLTLLRETESKTKLCWRILFIASIWILLFISETKYYVLHVVFVLIKEACLLFFYIIIIIIIIISNERHKKTFVKFEPPSLLLIFFVTNKMYKLSIYW